MTVAVCWQCGEFKLGACTTCLSCGAHPSTDDERVLSVWVTDHYHDRATLEQFGAAIKSGRRQVFDEETRKSSLEALTIYEQLEQL